MPWFFDLKKGDIAILRVTKVLWPLLFPLNKALGPPFVPPPPKQIAVSPFVPQSAMSPFVPLFPHGLGLAPCRLDVDRV
jgi:hypothetical protein